MAWTRELADALRIAADKIERHPRQYDWCVTSRCNCGLVAQELCGINARTLYEKLFKFNYRPHVNSFKEDSKFPRFYGLWTTIGKKAERCLATGKPIPAVLHRLFEAGMTKQDMHDLEYLGNKEVLRRAFDPIKIVKKPLHTMLGVILMISMRSLIYRTYSFRRAVVRYMRAWADIIDEQLGPVPEVPIEVVPSEQLAKGK